MAEGSASLDMAGGAMAKYAVRDELGRGGMGVVRLAEDRELRRELAIKVLLDADDDEDIAQFVEEAQITGQLEHPNIIPVHELGRDANGRPWLAMKLVRGETLMQRIKQWKKRSAPLNVESVQDILDIFGKVCDAVAFAHDHRVVHRDLKPDNIMLGEHGEVLLMDWGLAKPLDAPEIGRSARPRRPARVIRSDRRVSDSTALTIDGDIIGTPAYMPPEQAEGRINEVTPRSDIFALGAVLYHMLALELPYDGPSVEAVLVQAALRRLVPPRDRAKKRQIPKALSAIVMKAMAKRPADRYATVKGLQADLQAFLRHHPPSAYRGGIVERIVWFVRRHPTTSMAGMLSVLFLAVSGTVGSTLMAQAAADRERAEIERREAADARTIAMRAENEQRLAEQRQKAAELELLAQEGKIDELVGRLGGQLETRRDHVIGEFYRGFYDAMHRGERGAEYIRGLNQQKIFEFVDAFEALIDNHVKFGSEIPATANDYYYLGGMYHMGLDNLDAAERWYSRCLEVDANHTAARVSRGLIFYQKGRFDECMADLRVASALRPLDVPPTLIELLELAARGRTVEALARCQTMLRANPEQWDAWTVLGMGSQAMGNQRAADHAFDQALRFCPPAATDIIHMLRGFNK